MLSHRCYIITTIFLLSVIQTSWPLPVAEEDSDLEIRQEQHERQERRFSHHHLKNPIKDLALIQQDLDLKAPYDVDEQVNEIIVNREPVPHLWANFTPPEEAPAETVSCDVARAKCMNRPGCRMALENYVFFCVAVVEGKSKVCNEECKNSLVALMSTYEGQRLMKVKKDLCYSSFILRLLPNVLSTQLLSS